jgi:hypothetical protein
MHSALSCGGGHARLAAHERHLLEEVCEPSPPPLSLLSDILTLYLVAATSSI